VNSEKAAYKEAMEKNEDVIGIHVSLSFCPGQGKD
jgi:hypothetical protein